jgi:hypothetical protein
MAPIRTEFRPNSICPVHQSVSARYRNPLTFSNTEALRGESLFSGFLRLEKPVFRARQAEVFAERRSFVFGTEQATAL